MQLKYNTDRIFSMSY